MIHIFILLVATGFQYSSHASFDYETILPEDYSQNYAPSVTNTSSGNTDVECWMMPVAVAELSTKKMEIQVESGFYISWKDPRILIEKLVDNKFINVSIFPEEITRKLWYPILEYGNCKACGTLVFDPKSDFLKYDHRAKEIFTHVKDSNSYNCLFDMTNYPFDKQSCNVQIKTTQFQPISVRFLLFPNDTFESIAVPPEWTLYNMSISNCHYDEDVHGRCLKYTYHFKRRVARPILLIFLPSALIVILSWISFWLEPAAAAPRVALGLTSMLTLTTQFGSLQYNLPPVSIVTALDVWMFACIFSVFSSLCQYAMVHFFYQKALHLVKPAPIRKRIYSKSFFPNTAQIANIKRNVRRPCCCRFDGRAIDRLCRVLFPLMFTSFNIYFWYNYVVNF